MILNIVHVHVLFNKFYLFTECVLELYLKYALTEFFQKSEIVPYGSIESGNVASLRKWNNNIPYCNWIAFEYIMDNYI